MYERQHGGDLEVGSYAHRAILMDADDIPSIAESALSPTELPFTQEDFELQMEQALELVPDILGDERVGIRHAINGLLSLTPDGMPILGETPEVKGLWSAAAIWIKEAPGIARMVAEWMTDGKPEIDPHGSDIARFYDHQKARDPHQGARRPRASTRPTGSSTRPSSGPRNRDVRLSPFNARERELGAVFFEAAGWERPFWYASNEPLLDGVRRPGHAPRRPSGNRAGGRRSSTPSTSPCATGSGWSTCRRSRSSTSAGPGALDYLQRMAVAQMDVPVGRVVYTPLLNEAGGIKSDLTIMRLGRDQFRVVTGGAHGHARQQVVPRPPAGGRLGAAVRRDLDAGARSASGARGRATSSPRRPRTTSRTRASRSAPAGRSSSAASRSSPRGSRTSASSAGRSTSRWSRALRLWDTLWEAGQPHGIVPFGIGVYGTTGRLEKGYRAHGDELELEFDLVEAGMARPKVKEADFVGRAAYLEQRSRPPVAMLCTLTVDDTTSSSGVKRYMLGTRADPDARRRADHRRQGPSLVRDERRAPGRRSASTSCCRTCRPSTRSSARSSLVEYFGERYPVTVAVVGSTPLFDPENARVRA